MDEGCSSNGDNDGYNDGDDDCDNDGNDGDNDGNDVDNDRVVGKNYAIDKEWAVRNTKSANEREACYW